MRALAAAALLVGSVAVAEHATAQAGKLGVRAGIEHTSGEYGGTESFDDYYAPLTITYDARRVGLRLTVPYLRAETAVATVPDPVNAPDVVIVARETEGGLGDVIAGVTVYDVARSADGSFAFDVTAKAKLGTADEDAGLGTGENDYSVQADLFKFLARGTLSATIGRRVRGDPAGLELDDVWFVSAGGIRPLAESLRGGLFVDYRESSIPGGDAVRELSAFLSRRIGNRWRVQGYLLKGFSDSSADWGGGLSVSAGL